MARPPASGSDPATRSLPWRPRKGQRLVLQVGPQGPGQRGLEVEPGLPAEGQELADVGDSVFVHLIDGEGKLVGQADGLALANMYPFWICQAGDVVRDVRWMPVSGGLLPGEYALRVGLYDIGTGERRAVWDATGVRFTDDVVLAAVTSVTGRTVRWAWVG